MPEIFFHCDTLWLRLPGLLLPDQLFHQKFHRSDATLLASVLSDVTRTRTIGTAW